MKQLDHPNIVKLHGFIRTMNNTYIITEFCGGGDLRDYMKKHKRMNEKEALRIMSEIVAGVNELAKHDIIHRDLKPANILVQDGVFKLTDFGFAKKVDDYEEQMMVSLVGTPLYMSPQILKRQ
jgi:serine/threonine protein kinase